MSKLKEYTKHELSELVDKCNLHLLIRGKGQLIRVGALVRGYDDLTGDEFSLRRPWVHQRGESRHRRIPSLERLSLTSRMIASRR
jgi:hypothetical protein